MTKRDDYIAFRRSLGPTPRLTRRTVTARGIDFAVWSSPAVAGALPLLCINGGLLYDHTLLWPALSPLAAKRQLVFYDQRGRGATPAPPGAKKATIEHGGTNDTRDVDYSSVAFWYQTHPHAAFPPLPINLLPDSTGGVARFAGVIEAESLIGEARATAGTVQSQDMAEWESDSAAWSGGAQLWWTLARPGARLSLPIRVATAGRYDLTAWLTRAADYGNIRLTLNRRVLSPIVHGYAPDVSPTGPIDFGPVALKAGTNDLIIEIVGKDPESHGYSDGYLVGIDAFRLTPASASTRR